MVISEVPGWQGDIGMAMGCLGGWVGGWVGAMHTCPRVASAVHCGISKLMGGRTRVLEPHCCRGLSCYDAV